MQPSSNPPSSKRADLRRLQDPAATVHSPVMACLLVQLAATLCLSLAAAISNDWLWPGILAVWAGGGVAVVVTLFGAWRGLRRRRQNRPARDGNGSEVVEPTVQGVYAPGGKLSGHAQPGNSAAAIPDSEALSMLLQLYGAALGRLLLAGLLLGLAFRYLTGLSAPLLLAGFAVAYVAGVLTMAVKGFRAQH